ncbi:PROTEIN TESMIN/TSO1-LIKE CXC 4 [Salix purpurea]|uniref:PROTEIN TESMIN/TSO1-LIKE CXC 4 n=1 Tax=Salix purpurea TaxID=77065 RepID=A0A9Q1ALC3_SALPP|nr:PROTEIN TESMIN/TSO1-LIKE CXC 4 [Salix purpurea]
MDYKRHPKNDKRRSGERREVGVFSFETEDLLEVEEKCIEVPMELNTPNKNQIPATNPLSQFEDSPVFNYINNLSPIELVKSMHNGQAFNLPSFASPHSVFASPQLSSQSDARSFIRRYQFSEPSKPEFFQSKDENDTSKGVLEAAQLTECSTPANSSKGLITKLPGEHTESAIEEPIALKYYCASPDDNIIMVPLKAIIEPEMNEDEAGCDWVALISDVADILTLEPSIDEESDEKQKLQREIGEPGIQPVESGEQNEADQTPSVFPGTLPDKAAVNDAAAKVDIRGKSYQSSSKQNKIRRRCLVFEMGAHKKKLTFESSSSTLSQSDRMGASIEKHATPRTDKGKTLSALPGRGIGLHLNALTASSSGKAVKIETLASGKQEISQPPSPAAHMTSGSDPVSKSLALTTVETDFVPFDNKDKVMENAAKTLMVVTEDFGISSPKMKRQKMEFLGASSCKRCNCKRSKCLKLYCECFAAGLYCIEPCSCLECSNNPAHEETVLETRKQIESRNPLAFAPKVIRNSDSVSEFGVVVPLLMVMINTASAFRVVSVALPTVDVKDAKTLLVARMEWKKMTSNGRNLKPTRTHLNLNLLDIIEKGEDHPDLIAPSKDSRSPVHPQIPFSGQLSGSSLCDVIPEDETPEILNSNCLPTSGVKSVSPNSKRVSPPHHGFGPSTTWRRGRKLILRSISPSTSLNPPSEQ